jgi:hypothetical protein
MTWRTFVFCIAVLAMSPRLSAADNSSTDTNVDKFDSERAIAVDATIIAQTRLAKDRKDKIGNILVEFARHLYPTYEPLLLLRGKLKYKLKIDPPAQQGIGEAEFVYCLKKRVAALSKDNNIRDRHLSIVYSEIVRFFEPENSRALILLMKYEDEGEEMDLTKLLSKKFSTMPYFELDAKDPRYCIGNVEKTLKVPADEPWTDTWIKVQAGKIVRVEAKRVWSLGKGDFPYTDANGFDNVNLMEMVDKGNSGRHDRNYQNRFRLPKVVMRKLKGSKDMKPGCLLAKIGRQIYSVGKISAFKAESSGILYFGPFEWSDYSDNDGYLLVTVKISDK